MKDRGPLEGIYINHSFLPFRTIHATFRNTPYGETLINNIRYGRFKPHDITHQLWERELGIDVNNYKHLDLSFRLTQIFLNNCKTPPESWPYHVPDAAIFTQEEKELLLFTALVHDWAEAVVGDIPLPNKTKHDEEQEMIILKNIIKELLYRGEENDHFTTLSTHVLNILTDTSSKLGKAFNAIEKVGYIRTGIRAWIRSNISSGPIKDALTDLAIQVVPNQLPKLKEYAGTYPPVYDFIYKNQHRLDQIIAASQEQ